MQPKPHQTFSAGKLKSPVFVIGAAHSGKSAFAQQLLDQQNPATIIGTCDPLETAFQPRIKELKSSRPEHWHTIEDNQAIEQHLSETTLPTILDSVNQWIASRVLANSKKYSLAQLRDHIQLENKRLLDICRSISQPLIIVSSEVTAGVTPPSPMARLFRELTGTFNCQLATICPHVIHMVAGIPQTIKTSEALQHAAEGIPDALQAGRHRSTLTGRTPS